MAFTCSECVPAKPFKTADELSNHKRNQQNHKYRCSNCGKKFLTAEETRVHQLTHGKHVCPQHLCNQHFMDEKRLSKHKIKTEHAETKPTAALTSTSSSSSSTKASTEAVATEHKVKPAETKPAATLTSTSSSSSSSAKAATAAAAAVAASESEEEENDDDDDEDDDLGDRVDELEKLVRKQGQQLEEQGQQLKEQGEQLKLLRQAVMPMFAAPLPPLTASNIAEWCTSAIPSDQELDNIKDGQAWIKNQLGSGINIEGRWSRFPVVIGGSTAKGTCVKGQFDLDAVVFLPDFDSAKMQTYMHAFREHLERCDRELKWDDPSPAALRFSRKGLNVDLLFTGERKGNDPISYDDPATRFYMASLTEKQVAWVTDPCRLGKIEKDVIMGIKKFIHAKKWPIRRPSSYLLEVLTLHSSLTWLADSGIKGQACPVTENNRVVLFKLVLNTLQNLQSLEVRFNQTRPVSISKPYVLDPVNPHNNLLEGLNLGLIKLAVSAFIS